ncbi:hypothetical protein D9613_011010 [Agrocybe pediades]|uniref:F-box domain-containing protein n=1 Tax=Agrocybe pediades TaxID=84607 RepID=A0A8H4QM22_9AGAR|nr:hypothetical protein D9613_011010 [Agrocybe pediades]
MELEEEPTHRSTKDWKVAAIRKKLDICAQKLLEVNQHAANLEAEACRIREELNAVSAAIMSLPPEILIEIFLLLCESRRKDNAKRLCSEYPPQFLIGSVCSLWRRVAWGTSRVWRTVAITFSSRRIETQNQLLQEWMDRSRTSLLDIYLYSENLGLAEILFRNLYQPPKETFAIICATNERWRTLHTPRFTHLWDQFKSGNAPATSLYELCLSLPSTEEVQTIDWDLRGSVHLKKLNLEMRGRRGLVINWRALTHLQICTSPPECLYFLPNCLALESLTIRHGFHSEASLNLNDNGACTTRLTSLTHLSLCETPMAMENVWSYMTAPNLKDLTLSPTHTPDDCMRWSNSLIQFIRRSSCSLEKVAVCNVSTTCVHTLLEEARTVIQLIVVLSIPYGQQVISNAPVLNLLNSSLYGSCHLPGLEELCLSLKGDLRTDIDTLLGMIKSRVLPLLPPRNGQPPGKKIRKIIIMYHDTALMEDVEPDTLRRFYEELHSLSTSTGTSIKMVTK